MSLGQLVDQFELVTDTEEGFEELRKLILDQAVRGNLTKRNPNNESAEKLLNRIKEEKQRLYKDGEIRKPKDLPVVSKDEIPFKLPVGWTWTRVGTACSISGGKRVPKGYSLQNDPTPYIYIRVTDMKKGTVIDNDLKYISEEVKSQISKYTISIEDLYITIAGTIGDVGFIPEKFDGMNLTENAAKIELYFLEKEYLKRVLNSPVVQDQFFDKVNKMAQPKLALKRIRSTIFPLPPLEEQQRIVKKIETLFSQVDELEQKVQHDQEVDERLQVAVLDDLQRVRTPEASRQSWQRLTDHFEQIYRKPEHIEQLKQAILNEAVRGRLVLQDPNDEPAEKLLERITEEKQRLYEEGEIRKPKDLPEIKNEEIPYELPKGWIWARVGDIAKVVEYGTSQKSHEKPNGVPMLRMGNIDEFGNLTLDNLKYVDAGIDDLPRLYLKDKDLLFNRTNSYELVGKMGLFHGENDKYTFASYLIRVQLFHDLTSVEYIHNFINSENCRKVEIEPEITQQTNQANFNGTKLQHIRVPLPPLEEQKRIMDAINHLFAWCDDLKEKLSRSQQTGQRLLDALVNGE